MVLKIYSKAKKEREEYIKIKPWSPQEKNKI